MTEARTAGSNRNAPVRRNPLLLQLIITALLLNGAATAQQAETTPHAGWELRICAVEDNLPYSNRDLQGFENRIAALLVDELGAIVEYTWLTRTHNPALEESLLRRTV